ncbi:MAG: VIT and VWA domain-containing protein, partial [Phycisphaerae bacterium]|nr:VIT and VWA domain-containing protein [Phycisphaerae bacterium]
MTLKSTLKTLAALLLPLALASMVMAHSPSQAVVPPASLPSVRPWNPPPRIIVPQIGRVAGSVSSIEITAIRARVDIRDTIAVTTMELDLANRSGSAQEATMLVPVPSAATVNGFTFEGPFREPTARVLSRHEARQEYDAIVARERDPALLEWAGWNVVRTSVFPVPPHGTRKVRIAWEELLIANGDRLDYTLPRSDLQHRGPAWQIEINVASSTTIAGIFSPTHEVRTLRRGEQSASLVATDRGAAASGALRLSIVRSAGPSATVITYPDPSIGGGYFLLLAVAPQTSDAQAMPRDIVLVLDRSGSMAGAPLEQAKVAATRIVNGLRDGERVNVIDFSNGVSSFAPSPATVNAGTRDEVIRYIAALHPAGGTNIHDALLEALRQDVAPGALPLCLFLTDGLPTIGKTLERDIRAMAEDGNPTHRRIFTVGVGPDVNVPLLDRIADGSRALAAYVTPGDDLATKVADIAERLAGPVIADTVLAVDENGRESPGRISETVPTMLPDLFRGSGLPSNLVCGGETKKATYLGGLPPTQEEYATVR